MWCKTHLRRQSIINKNVWPCCVRSKGPNRSGSQQIPVVLRLEKLSQLLPDMRKQNGSWLRAGLCILCQLEHYKDWLIEGAEGLMEEDEESKRFSLMVCEACHFSGIATPRWHRWAQMASYMSRALTGNSSRVEHTHAHNDTRLWHDLHISVTGTLMHAFKRMNQLLWVMWSIYRGGFLMST